MTINKMKKSEAVNVYMEHRNVWGETTSIALIATFRSNNWADAFIEMEMKERPNVYSDYCVLTKGDKI